MKQSKKQRGPYGKNMIRLTVKFFTNNLPKGADEKTAWVTGVIHVLKNELKGIKPKQIFFRDLEDFPKKMQQILDESGIRLIEVPKEKFDIKRFDDEEEDEE